MIQEIENRRSIRKYKADKINKELIEDIIYSATPAPSAKNRQPWKFIVYQGKEKEKLVDVMLQGINSEKITHALMKEWRLPYQMLRILSELWKRRHVL